MTARGNGTGAASGAGLRRACAATAVTVAVVVLLVAPPVSGQPVTTPTTPTTATTSTSTTTTTRPTTSTSSTSSTSTSTTSTTEPPGGPGTTPTTTPAPGNGLTPDQVDQLTQLTGDYEAISAEEIDLVRRVLDATQLLEILDKQLDTLNGSVAGTTLELAEAQGRVAVAETRLAGTEARLADAEDRMASEQGRLRTRAIEAYVTGNVQGTAAGQVLLRTSSMNEFGTGLVYEGAVVEDQRTIVRRVEELRSEVQRLRDEAARARDDAVAARDVVARRDADLRLQRDQIDTAQLQLRQASDEQSKVLGEVSAERAAYAARIAGLSTVSDGISGTLARLQAAQLLPVTTTGIFITPVPGARISSLFGGRVDPFFGTARQHNGVDLVAPFGTPIRASGDGVVVIAGDQGGYGNCTVIDHGNGLATLYGHQSTLLAQPGTVVRRGDIIGFEGSTGRSTGPHVHWEVRRYGQPVDPLPYLGPG